jgi:hypothetical protein
VGVARWAADAVAIEGDRSPSGILHHRFRHGPTPARPFADGRPDRPPLQ